MTHLQEHWEGVSLCGNYTLEKWLGGDDSAAFVSGAPTTAPCLTCGGTRGDIPEPATLAVFGAGLLGLGAVRRRESMSKRD